MRTGAGYMNATIQRRRRLGRWLLFAPSGLIRAVTGAGLSLVVLVVLVAAVGGVGVLMAERLTEAAMERYGSILTGTRIAVARVGIDADRDRFRGTAMDFRVGNPAGYRRGDAFRIRWIAVDAKPDHLFADPAVVRRILISGLRVSYEFGLDGSSNIEAIERNIADSLRRRWGGPAGAASASAASCCARRSAIGASRGPRSIAPGWVGWRSRMRRTG